MAEPEVAATEAPIDTFTLPRPKRRALSPQQVATRTAPDNAPDSAYAIKTSQSPKARPKGLKAVAAKIRKERNSVDAIVAKTHAPKKTAPASSLRLPSNASVKKAATIRNGINQRKISLLGVTGTSSKRKALIRMPRGKIVTVRRGGRVDGWRVSAIGEQSVRLQKGNRSQVLRLPN